MQKLGLGMNAAYETELVLYISARFQNMVEVFGCVHLKLQES